MTTTLIPETSVPEHVINDSRTPVLSVQGLTKKFTDVLASNNLTLDIYAGHARAAEAIEVAREVFAERGV